MCEFPTDLENIVDRGVAMYGGSCVKLASPHCQTAKTPMKPVVDGWM